MTKTPKKARLETATFVGGNAFVYLSMARQSADAWAGGALLVLGFAAQFVGTVTDADTCLRVALPAAALIVLAASVLLIRVIRPFFVRRAIEDSLGAAWPRYHREYANRPDEAVRQWWVAVESWGQHVIGERHGEESRDDYGRRFLGARRWTRLVAGKPPPTDYVAPAMPSAE